MILENYQNQVNQKLEKVVELTKDMKNKEEQIEEYVDYLMDLNPKYMQGGQEQIDREIEENYEKLETYKTEIGLTEAEHDLRTAENQLLNYFFNNLHKMGLTQEAINDYTANKTSIMNNVVRRDQLIYTLL